MTLVLDNREELGQAPGLHVLIAGVSAYTHLPGGGGLAAPDDFGMQQLTSTALSAFRVYEWLRARENRFPVPVATIRLLLAPSPSEIQAEPALANNASSCSLSDFRKAAADWRTDSSGNRAGMALFYFAGHGVQRTKGDAVLLLQNFGDGEGGTLDKTVNIKNLYYGMAPTPTRPEIARTQLYFVDACRMRPERFSDYEQMETNNVWDVENADTDDRCAPTYFAAVPGAVAYARPGRQTLFNEALLECLKGGAAELQDDDGEECWVVTHLTLAEKLAEYLSGLAGDAGAEQWIRTDGIGGDAVFHYLDGPPPVQVELEIDPIAALGFAQVAIFDDAGQPATLAPLPKPLEPHPFATELPAGIYTISTEVDPGSEFVNRPGRARPLLPPAARRVIRVAP